MSEKKVKNPPKKKNHELTFIESRDKLLELIGNTGTLAVELLSKSRSLDSIDTAVAIIKKINSASGKVDSQHLWHNFFWNSDGTRKQELPEAVK